MTFHDDPPEDCPHCGAPVTSGPFCSACGGELADVPTRPMRSLSPPRPHALPPRRTEQSTAPHPESSRGVIAMFAAGLTLILLLLGVTLYVGDVFNSSNSPIVTQAAGVAGTATPSTGTATAGTTPSYTTQKPTAEGHSLTRSTKTFAGRMFTIEYPSAWRVMNSEKQYSWGTDTTIGSPTDANTLLRVDVTAKTTANDARASAQPVIDELRRQPGYQLIDDSSYTIDGFEALHWEFRVVESGITVHKEDVFFIDSNGSGVAVLTQSPDDRYEELRSQFSMLRQSLSMNST